jgi:hypothetical protein
MRSETLTFNERAGLYLGLLLSASLLVLLVYDPRAFTIGSVVAASVALVEFSYPLSSLRTWQKLAFLAIAGYVVLNYGFTNWSLPIGKLGIPWGYLIAFGALGLAVRGRARDVRRFFHEPVARWFLALLGLTLLHWVVDLPRYGAWAIRDASFVIEGFFLLLGYLWATDGRKRGLFLKCLVVLFVLNLIYSMTFPWQYDLQDISLARGVFREVSLLGNYANNSLFLLTGALFFLLLGTRLTKWPRWLLLALTLVQVAWLLVFQSRTMYVATVLVVLVMMLFGEARRGLRTALWITAGFTSLLLFLSLSGIKLHGRVGKVSANFLVEHSESMLLVQGTPAVGSAEWRLMLIPPLWARITSSAENLIWGEGYGLPLIDFHGENGAEVRQPHDTHLSVLARLGLIGLACWLLLHLSFSLLCLRAMKRTAPGSFARLLFLWLFLFYLTGMLLTTTEPWLEFSYGAIPFYTVMGYTIGLLRSADQTPDSRRALGRGRMPG